MDRIAALNRAGMKVVASALLIITCACGGGGGGGGEAGGGSGGVSQQPTAPPAPPNITYTGMKSAALLDDISVPVLAEATRGMLLVAIDLAEDIYNPASGSVGPINETQAGPSGGSVHLTGYGNANGTVWVTAEFTDYRDGNGLLNGKQTIEDLELASSTNNHTSISRVSFDSLRLQADDLDATYTGSITRTDCCATRRVTGAVLIRDNEAGVQFYAENIDLLTVNRVDGNRELGGSSRVYGSDVGFVDVTFEGPWYLEPQAEVPHHGGALKGTGAGGRYFEISPLLSGELALEYVADGATQPTRSTRLNWEQSFEEQVEEPLDSPVADAGAARFVVPNTKITLDGRFSTHPQRAFLGFSWQLLFKPPGSATAIVDTSAVQPQITLDVEGRYIVELAVTDGVRTSRDVIALTVDPQTDMSTSTPSAQLTADERRSSYAPFSVTPLRYLPADFDALGFGLQLDVRDPIGTPLSVPLGNDVTPMRAGVYRFTLSHGLSQAGVRPIDEKWVAVDVPIPLAPAGGFFLDGLQARGLSAADLNDDGFTDLAAVVDTGANGIELQLFYGKPDGQLSDVVVLDAGSASAITAADVTGDQKPDLITLGGNQLQVFTRVGAGNLVLAQSLSVGSDADAGIGVGDLDGDGRVDVAVMGPGGVEYFLQSSAGQLNSAGIIAGSSGARLTVGDVSGDGIADVIVSGHFAAPGSQPYRLLRGVPGGLPANVETLPYQTPFTTSRVAPVSIVDLNGDGKADLLSAVNATANGVDHPQVLIFIQDANGGLQSPRSVQTSGITTRLTAVDLDRDGNKDIVKQGGGFAGLNIHYGSGAGFFGTLIGDTRPTLGAWTTAAYADATLDLNNDGLLDCAFVTEINNRAVLGVALGRAY